MRFLESMKQRSNEVKSRIAIVCAFVITGVIALVWVSTIPARLDEVSKAYEESNTTESAKSALTDLVEQVKQNAPLQNEFDTEEDPSSFTEPQGASALDALMREGFDPEAVKVSSTSSDQDTVSPPPVTAEGESFSSEETPSPTPSPSPIIPTSPVPLPSEVVHTTTPTPTTTKPIVPPPPRTILIGTTTSSKR
jgi:hypothetical protein